MKNWLSFPSVQIALCTLVFGLIGYWLADSVLGRLMTVLVGWVYAAAITRPLMNLVANFRRNARAAVWLPVHGMHYVFKDTTIHVLEDDDNWRWVPLADVEVVLGRKPMPACWSSPTLSGSKWGANRPACTCATMR